MAVTYAWRLDANKYAYLVDPEKGEYGYVSESPLNGTQLATVSKTCNERFGEDGYLGFSGYKIAFEAMVKKINNKWKSDGAEFYDLLSADVYYNVDASYCADLRGVGIRGIRYLGASKEYDPNNPSWNPSIKQTNTTELAGKFSVYGIYMDDQNGDETDGISPERIFAVYNGADGTNAEGNFGTGTLQEMIEAEQKTRAAADTEHGAAISQLRKDVDLLTGLQGGDLSSLMDDLKGLKDRVTTLENNKANLESQINELRAELAAIKNPTNGGGGVNNPTTGGGSVTIEDYYEGEVMLVGVGDDDVLYKLPRMHYDGGKVTATSFYQE
jgi:hypothetical protein